MGQDRPLGVVLRDLLPPAGPRVLLPAETLVAFASLADRLGYSTVWVPEGRGREATATLGAMGQATSRVCLATGITPFYARPPALLTMAAATLADLTGGRFILGLGAGHAAVVEDGYGQKYREPLVAAREVVGIIRRALAGEHVTAHGRIFRVASFQLESRPHHPVPIFLAALGPKMLRLAGEIADGVILNWSPPEQVAWAAGVVREAARRAGRDPGAVTVVAYVRAAVTEAEEAEEAAWQVMRRLLAAYATMPAYGRMFRAAGLEVEILAAEAARKAGGIDAAAAAFSEEFLRTMAVVGPAAACLEALEAYRQAGADVVAAYPFPVGLDAAGSMRETIEALGPTAT